ncbi:MAG: hypothetical protein M3N49_12295 [Candidatus Eremiobacteraeota bacterium]|nr:hypothetical protein [Candidatus Eremiobacteraeota bacterium]
MILRTALLIAIVTMSAIVTLSLSKGAPASAADGITEPLLIATPQRLVYADGNARKFAGAGTLARGFRILGAVADGSVVVSYYDANSATVEAIGRDLSPRAVKKFGVFPVAFIAPSNDGFLAYDGGLLRRYDLHGSLIGQPIAPVGARDALGFADATVVIASGRLGIYDRSGRLQHQMIVAADRLVALPGDRFAVTDTRNSEVRVYTTALELKSTLRFPNRQLLAVAAGPDGALAVANGHASCTNPDVEVDVFNDINAQPTARMRTDVGTPVALAVGTGGIYVANAPCRRDDDGYIAVFGRDGGARELIRNVGTPTGLIPLAAVRQ